MPPVAGLFKVPFRRLSCAFNTNITSGAELATNRKSLLILVFPNDVEEFSMFPLPRQLPFLRVFSYVFELTSMNLDHRCVLYVSHMMSQRWIMLLAC